MEDGARCRGTRSPLPGTAAAQAAEAYPGARGGLRRAWRSPGPRLQPLQQAPVHVVVVVIVYCGPSIPYPVVVDTETQQVRVFDGDSGSVRNINIDNH